MAEDKPKDERTDYEFLLDHVRAEGFDVKTTVNGGFIVEAYDGSRGTVRAAFTRFDDLVAWVGTTLNGDTP